MSFAWRDLVWLAVGLLGAYAGVLLARLFGLGSKAPGAVVQSDGAPEGTPSSQSAAFQHELELRRVRRELAELQGRLDSAQAGWQAAWSGVESELSRLKESQESLQTQRHVSPQYGEAMVLARRGLEPEAVAERCGISVAEAGLVCALARGGPEEENLP